MHQRIRDPIHDLIEFNTDLEIERKAWDIIQTEPFQRLRRVKQLGFSDFVFPGACHSRFAHSIGVFNTARQLAAIVEAKMQQEERAQRDICLAAALVHDVGHGAFSHSFETVAKRLELPIWKHEEWSDRLIREGEIAEILNHNLGGFADNVADTVKGRGDRSVYSTIVSSQFDADRLDYMRRDRLMTGTRHAQIDFNWLISNLKIGDVPYGSDDSRAEDVKTFIIDPKAIYAAETYIHGLFQLYPTVYFHKTTRCAELIFQEIIFRLFSFIREDNVNKTGLSENNPIVKFARDPENLDLFVELDDSVFTGSLRLVSECDDGLLAELSERLLKRKFYKVIDLMKNPEFSKKESAERKEIFENCVTDLREWSCKDPDKPPRILFDSTKRSPYKTFDKTKSKLEQINVESSDGPPKDLRDFSDVVKAIKDFEFYRMYVDDNDDDAKAQVEKVLNREIKNDGQFGFALDQYVK